MRTTLTEAANKHPLVALPTRRTTRTIDVDLLAEALNSRPRSLKDLKRRDTTCSTTIATRKLTSLKSTTDLTSSNTSTSERSTTLGELVAAVAMTDTEEVVLLQTIMALLIALLIVMVALLIAMAELLRETATVLLIAMAARIVRLAPIVTARLLIVMVALTVALIAHLLIAMVEVLRIATETVDPQIATADSIVLLLVVLTIPSVAEDLLATLAALLLALAMTGHLPPPHDRTTAAMDARTIVMEDVLLEALLRLAEVATIKVNNNKIVMVDHRTMDARADTVTTGEDLQMADRAALLVTIAMAKVPTVPRLLLLPTLVLEVATCRI